MDHYARQIRDGGDKAWCWVILRASPDDPLTFSEHSAGECEWDTYQAALDNGAIALARLQGQPYENEGADPVGSA